ncbi:MAG: hypothetical protein C4617_01275 [Candidatus Liberibacter europaeus]|uniref:LPS export ABC transporter periplasmic protein LptC n=1 Tax=Candidatus Liberibacter europaeus TaxID=744859 RepID=A0A2T4VZ60_9HYPH|nr:hypothetical protein [Candidatus Liberibacter europaeus]PTL87061.1 MAG: hypothetical protein C4617_01275 [Candidatus Liberibacter europaeus]
MTSVDQIDYKNKILLQKQKAYHHSRFVWCCKIILPVIAITLLFWLLLVSWMRLNAIYSMPVGFDISASAGHTSMKKLIMSNYGKDSNVYSLVSDSVNTTIDNQNIYLLRGINLTVTTNGGGSDMKIIADSAQFDLYKNVLDINKPFNMILKGDTKMNCKSGIIDVKNSTMRSEECFLSRNRDLNILSHSCQIEGNSKVVTFSGGVLALMKI